jgi:hypothetical protein
MTGHAPRQRLLALLLPAIVGTEFLASGMFVFAASHVTGGVDPCGGQSPGKCHDALANERQAQRTCAMRHAPTVAPSKQADYAQKMIDEYKQAGVPPQRVFA